MTPCNCPDCRENPEQACNQDCDRENACIACQEAYDELDEIRFESGAALGYW